MPLLCDQHRLDDRLGQRADLRADLIFGGRHVLRPRQAQQAFLVGHAMRAQPVDRFALTKGGRWCLAGWRGVGYSPQLGGSHRQQHAERHTRAADVRQSANRERRHGYRGECDWRASLGKRFPLVELPAQPGNQDQLQDQHPDPQPGPAHVDARPTADPVGAQPRQQGHPELPQQQPARRHAKRVKAWHR